MHKYLGILAMALVVGCGGKDGGGDDDDDTTSNPGDDDDDDDNGSGCDNEIVSMFPEDGANNAFYRTTVEFELESAAGSEAITVMSGGAEVSGSSSVVGNRVVWMPSAPLNPAASYDVTLDWECGPTSVSWMTSSTGGAVADPDSLVGDAYLLDLGSGRFVKPNQTVGDLLTSQLTQGILIGVKSYDGTSIEMRGALEASSGGQDLCTESIEFPVAADFTENPYFQVGPDVVTLNVQGISITIDELVVSGAFAADGSAIEGAVLQGSIDTRSLKDLVGVTADDGVCQLVASFGVPCEACAGGGTYCLSVLVDSMAAARESGVTLVEVTSAQAATCN